MSAAAFRVDATVPSGSVSGHTSARVVRSYLILTSATLAAQGLTFLSIAYLARALGVAAFGDVALAQAVILYFKLLSDLGLELLGTKRVAARRGAVREQAGRFLAGRSLQLAAAWLLLVALVALMPWGSRLKFLLLLYGASLLPTAWLLEWVYVGLERMWAVGASRVVSAAVNLLLVVALVRAPGDVLRVPLAYATGFAASAVLLLALFRRSHGWPALGVDWRWWRQALREALPMGLAFITIQVYYSFATLFLGVMEGPRTVGLYAAPQKVVFFMTGLAALFGTSIYPRLVALVREGDRDRLDRLMAGAVRVTGAASLPVAVGIALVARPLLVALFGPAYAESATAFRLLAWSVVTVFGNVPFAYVLLASGRQRHYLLSVLAGAVVNVVANLVLIPRLHLQGAALATLCSEVVVLTSLYVCARAVSRVNVAGAVWPAVAAASIMAGVLVPLAPATLLLQVPVAAVVYVGVLAACGGVRARDVAVLREAIGRSR